MDVRGLFERKRMQVLSDIMVEDGLVGGCWGTGRRSRWRRYTMFLQYLDSSLQCHYYIESMKNIEHAGNI